MVHPRGLEPLTFGSVDRRSIQLSYGCTGWRVVVANPSREVAEQSVQGASCQQAARKLAETPIPPGGRPAHPDPHIFPKKILSSPAGPVRGQRAVAARFPPGNRESAPDGGPRTEKPGKSGPFLQRRREFQRRWCRSVLRGATVVVTRGEHSGCDANALRRMARSSWRQKDTDTEDNRSVDVTLRQNRLQMEFVTHG